MELVEDAHPFIPLLVAVGQDQNGGFVAAGGREVGCCHLRREEEEEKGGKGERSCKEYNGIAMSVVLSC